MNLRQYKVGKPFEEGINWYNEETRFDFDQSGPILLIFLENPTVKEIEAIRAGEVKIGFYEIDGIIFMLFKFEEIPWIDAPYSIHLSGNTEPVNIEEDKGYGLQIFLIDANTGILKVIRLIGMGNEWSRRFREAILKQKNTKFDPYEYNQKIEKIYRTYSSRKLAEMIPTKNGYRVRGK